MTFENPAALALLLAAPLAWILYRRRRSAQVVRVASLLAFASAAAATPSTTPRRAFDARLAATLTAIALLAFAAAGPTFGARRGAALYVVIDGSPSTSSRTCDVASRATAILRDAAPDAERVDHPLGPKDAPDGLPTSLAPHLAAARDEGFRGVVLVTDARIDAMPGVAVVGPSAGAKTNVALTSASLDGNDAVVVARNFGRADVAARIRCADVVRDVVVPAGGVATARFVAPDRGESATIEIESPQDDLAADDRIVVARKGGAKRVRLDATAPCPRLTAALRAAGAEIVASGGCDVEVAYRTPIHPVAASPLFVVAPDHRLSTGWTPVVWYSDAARADVVRGDVIVGRGDFAGVLPSPASSIVVDAPLRGGTAVWSSHDGVVVATATNLLVLAVDPEDARSDWHRDPSFPAFIAAALDHLAGGPDRLESAYVVAESESDVVHDPPRTSSADEIRAVMRPAGAVPDAVRPAQALALAAGALLVASLFLRGR